MEFARRSSNSFLGVGYSPCLRRRYLAIRITKTIRRRAFNSLESSHARPQLAETMADVVRRIIDRGMTMGAGLRLTGDNIGCVDAHVASGTNVTKALRARTLGSEIMVGTPEIWQGLQRPVMVVKHRSADSKDWIGLL